MTMSYDVFCYPSQLGYPDLEEARSIIEGETPMPGPDPAARMSIIEAALVAQNPRLQKAYIDVEANKQIAEEMPEFANIGDYIELNTPGEQPCIQILIFEDQVALSVPYWYKDEEARQVFEEMNSYLVTIAKTVGYFSYDPQTEMVFNPLETTFLDEGYNEIMQTHILPQQHSSQQDMETGFAPDNF